MILPQIWILYDHNYSLFIEKRQVKGEKSGERGQIAALTEYRGQAVPFYGTDRGQKTEERTQRTEHRLNLTSVSPKGGGLITDSL